MLRGFRLPYKKLFDGEVFTTVRLVKEFKAAWSRTDVIYLYPRTKRALRLGRAQIIIERFYPSIFSFKRFCTEEFAQYDAEITRDEFITSLTKQGIRRKLIGPWVIVYTYLWTDKEEGYYEAKEGMQ